MIPNAPKSVAIISNYAPSLVNFRGPLIRELAGRGAQVFALAPDYDEASRGAIERLGGVPVDYRMDRVGTSIRGDMAALVELYRILRRLEPEVSLGYFIKPVIYGGIAAALARVPRRFAMVEGLGYVFTDIEQDSFKRKALRSLLKILFRVSFRFTHGVFFLNPDDLAAFVNGGLVKASKARNVGPIGVELDRFEAVPPPPAPPLAFLFIGRLLREKGVREFAEAARLVRASGAEASFVILGDHDVNPGAIPRAEVERWVREGLVDWPGQVDDVRPWLARSHVFVLPSWREGYPRSTQEAMAMGRAVITTDVPGCRETIVDGSNGFLVPVRDPAALASAMMRFVGEPELAPRMGQASRRIAEARFDVRAVNRGLLEAMGIGLGA